MITNWLFAVDSRLNDLLWPCSMPHWIGKYRENRAGQRHAAVFRQIFSTLFSPRSTFFVTMWKMMPQEIECSHGESSHNWLACGLCQVLVSANPVACRQLVTVVGDCLIVCPPTKLLYWAVRNQHWTWTRSYWDRQYDCAFYVYVLRMNTNTHRQSKPSSDIAPRHHLPKENLMKTLRAYRTYILLFSFWAAKWRMQLITVNAWSSQRVWNIFRFFASKRCAVWLQQHSFTLFSLRLLPLSQITIYNKCCNG